MYYFAACFDFFKAVNKDSSRENVILLFLNLSICEPSQSPESIPCK